MSIFICIACDRQLDSDQIEMMEWSDGYICKDCYGPEQYAKQDYEMGGGLGGNRYERDLDPLSDWSRYNWHMHHMQLNELRQIRFEDDFRRIIGG